MPLCVPAAWQESGCDIAHGDASCVGGVKALQHRAVSASPGIARLHEDHLAAVCNYVMLGSKSLQG